MSVFSVNFHAVQSLNHIWQLSTGQFHLIRSVVQGKKQYTRILKLYTSSSYNTHDHHQSRIYFTLIQREENQHLVGLNLIHLALLQSNSVHRLPLVV